MWFRSRTQPTAQPTGQPTGRSTAQPTLPSTGQPTDDPWRGALPGGSGPGPVEDTSVLPPYDAAARKDTATFGDFGFSEAPADSDRPRATERSGRPAKAVVAGILAAALGLGAVAGVAGAAGYDAVDDEASTSSTSGGTTSTVVDRGNAAPDADSVEQVAASVLPSVVKINVAGTDGQGSGSGVVISSDGEILTNEHVASVAEQGGAMTVNFNDGTTKRARIVGTDPVTDLAVIRAEGVSGLQPATIGRSGDIAVGENVVAIGSPFGLEATVTSGIVSALNRPVSVGGSEGSTPGEQPQDTTYPAIQTDAAINPGNSGGPLVDLNGDVVGINSSIRTASSGGLDASPGGSIGLGFAIPIDNVWPIVQQLRSGETPTHARMGVSVVSASSDDGLLTGAGVGEVEAGSAAARAGIRRGDVITKVDDVIITDSQSLVAIIRGQRPGQKVSLTVVADGASGGDRSRTVTVTLDSDADTASG
ncbi:MAG TPA: trypsin-like peptidase domain-containing protein [Nocardioidaceae bacterium]|nr:trypsin-like peptidase domain-containing protein [Nocardioidaceae bacterium]